MRRLLRWYGANPLHLLALLGCFAIAGYASVRLVKSPHPLGVAIWFIGAVVGHDLLLVPLYSLADRSAMAVIRHRAPRLPAIPWINYLRVPTALSALLLLIWLPLILRLTSHYQFSTTLSPNPYLGHWLAVTGALFLLSAAAFALRLRGRPRAAVPAGDGVAPPPAVAGDGAENAPGPGGSPAPGAPGSTPQRPGTAQEDQHEPEASRPLRTPSGADRGGSAEQAPGPGPHEPAGQAQAAAPPADHTDQAAAARDAAKDGQAHQPPDHP